MLWKRILDNCRREWIDPEVGIISLRHLSDVRSIFLYTMKNVFPSGVSVLRIDTCLGLKWILSIFDRIVDLWPRNFSPDLWHNNDVERPFVQIYSNRFWQTDVLHYFWNDKSQFPLNYSNWFWLVYRISFDNQFKSEKVVLSDIWIWNHRHIVTSFNDERSRSSSPYHRKYLTWLVLWIEWNSWSKICFRYL